MRPYEFDELLSVFTVGTMVCPGTVTIQGLGDPENWNVKKAKGTTGSSTTLEGKDPRKFTTVIYLADDETGEQFYIWPTFRALVESTVVAGQPKAIPVYHPDLANAKITEASKDDIKGPVYDGKGGATYTIDWIEYKPPKPKPPARPRATAAGATTQAGRDSYDPNAAAKAELEGLLAEARRPL